VEGVPGSGTRVSLRVSLTVLYGDAERAGA
jgi:hypothetical protein